jgi:hypothetical protein
MFKCAVGFDNIFKLTDNEGHYYMMVVEEIKEQESLVDLQWN